MIIIFNSLAKKEEEKRIPNLPGRCAEYHHQVGDDGCSNGWPGRGQQEWRIILQR
jgi:hypothetical protein